MIFCMGHDTVAAAAVVGRRSNGGDAEQWKRGGDDPMATTTADSFDYVIVGAGAAGAVLANRLSEDSGVTVCVLEAGPADWNPWIHIPAGFIKTLFDPSCTWQFKTEPTANTGGRPIATTQGRTLGGSSSINGMVYNRGQPAD